LTGWIGWSSEFRATPGLPTRAAEGDRLMELTEDDVLEILRLFEQSKFDFLQLEQGERKITVSKGGYVASGPAAAAAAAPVSVAPATSAPAPAPATSVMPAPGLVPAEPGLVPIPAPMVGKFYAAPSPSEPPYAAVGTAVEAGATVGLIEVMKVFTSVKTETAGTIERILVSNGQFVEFGQPLFLLRPKP
jgi:acetyl-CoA carboxylase biotin carboxyl carrier protein